MTRLLIVDDEKHTVDSIRLGMDWEGLGISEIFTAYNIRQAKEIFEREPVEIMLCDIEMPQGSGLELLAWIRETGRTTETVFLTCHADFSFAKQAIKLDSFEYLLKPVPFAELESVIRRVKEKIDKDSDLISSSRYGHLWFRQQPLLVERFWLDILNQTIPPHSAMIAKEAADRSIPFMEHMQIMPILIRLQRWHKPLSARDEKIMEYALRKAAEETILDQKMGALVVWDKDRMVVLLNVEPDNAEAAELKAACMSFIAACHAYFFCNLCCYIGFPVYPVQLADAANRLLAMDRDNVSLENRVLLLGEPVASSADMPLPNLDVWAVLLEKGKKDELIKEACSYLDRCRRAEGFAAGQLHQFHQNFIQMVYYVLKTKGIQAHLLIRDRGSLELAAAAANSVMDMREWVVHTLQLAADCIRATEQTRTVVERVTSYIQLHLTKEMTREEIAGHVYLSPDHLTRIFKKETGMSVSEYLLQERLKLAKHLLAKTDMPVSAIAAHIGYSNFSHFSKMFKKHTGLNPLDYRMAQMSD